MKICHFAIVAFVMFFGIFTSNVNAEEVNFSISANNLWAENIYNPSSTKNFGNRYSAVNWKTSNKTNHKMWFRVRAVSDDTIKGSGLLNYLTTGAFLTNNESNSEYYLQAKRENLLDPLTVVTGSWIS